MYKTPTHALYVQLMAPHRTQHTPATVLLPQHRF